MNNTVKIIIFVSLFLVAGVIAALWTAKQSGSSGKPVLNKQTASIILSNGTPEKRVYELLGTNAATSTGQKGQKDLLYFFMFTGAPPKVTSEVSNITIVLSNGVVIDRIFPETR